MTLGDNQMIFPANRTDYGSAEISRMSTFLTARENQGDDALSFPDYKVATDFPLDALPESIRAAVIEICRETSSLPRLRSKRHLRLYRLLVKILCWLIEVSMKHPFARFSCSWWLTLVRKSVPTGLLHQL
jgi:hypothetical protein